MSSQCEDDAAVSPTVSSSRMSLDDFITISVIGKGAYGEVRLVRAIESGEIFAMKVIEKADMIRRRQTRHVRAERDCMARADSDWLVQLLYSFQDEHNLYLVMEFLQGGDLLAVLCRKQRLTEEETRFYIAEIAMAIHSVHELDYVHRDLKPDNILIDEHGHIKLTDFGLCKSFDTGSSRLRQQMSAASQRVPVSETVIGADDAESSSISALTATSLSPRPHHTPKQRRALAFSTVGAPDYIAPEMFSDKGYGAECDFWSLGIIMFECLLGYPPFYHDEVVGTCRNIMNWRRTLKFPASPVLSTSARDLITSLITSANRRLTFEQLQRHSFFLGVDWENLRTRPAPIVPVIEGPLDIRNFEKHFAEEEESQAHEQDNGDNHHDKDEDQDKFEDVVEEESDPAAAPETSPGPAKDEAPSAPPKSSPGSPFATQHESFIGFTFKRYDVSGPSIALSSMFDTPPTPPSFL